MKNIILAYVVARKLFTVTPDDAKRLTHVNIAFGLVNEDCTLNTVQLDDIGIDFTTTHGYQIDKHFFVGAGVGCSIQSFPVFAAARYDILDRHVTPALEVRWGRSFGNRKSPYFSLTGAVRIRMGSWGGLNISCGYLHHAAWIDFEEPDNPNIREWDDVGCFVHRIGFEF